MSTRSRLRAIICAILSIFGVNCGGGGNNPPPSPVREQYPLPDFQYRRSEFLSNHHGTAVEPLRLNAPFCSVPWLQPPLGWQNQLCDGSVVPPTIWPQSNSFRTYSLPAPGGDHNVWKVAVNNEFSWDLLNSGPPDHSLPLNTFGSPFRMSQVDDSLRMGLFLTGSQANNQKAPYLALNYTRGTQGDTTRRIYPWGADPVLTFDATVRLSVAGQNTEAQWVEVWLFFRDPATQQQFMVRHDPWMAKWQRDAFGSTIWQGNWNWPMLESYYYPGAKLAIVVPIDPSQRFFSAAEPTAAIDSESKSFTFQVEQIGLKAFPEFATMKPDFLGFEIALEMGYSDYAPAKSVAESVELDIKNIKLMGWKQ